MATENSTLPDSLASSGSNSATDDASSLYYLHQSNSPSLILVSQPLIGDNYASWSKSMVIALSVKNKLGFVDGSIPKPEGNDSFARS